MQMLESKIEKYLRQRVTEMGGRCEKVTVIGERGFFDRLITLPGGRIIFCEVKRPKGGRLSIHQIWWRTAYRALGAEVALIKTVDEVDALLTAPKR